MKKLIMIAVMLAASSAPADVVRVTIPIDGALCGFCMAGIESRFKSTQPGLTGYRLSIRERIADLQFDGTRPVDVDALRKIIADYGYTPREPIVTLRGTVERSGESDVWLQGVNVDERHLLTNPTASVLAAAQKNAIVTVTGTMTTAGQSRAIVLVEPPSRLPTAAEPREEKREAPRVSVNGEWQMSFAPEHLLQHSEALKLSSEQVIVLRKANDALHEEIRKQGEVITHCDGEVFETLAQKMMLGPDDERFILHEVEEISEAKSKIALARARAALAAWKELQPGQRKRWIEIVTQTGS